MIKIAVSHYKQDIYYFYLIGVEDKVELAHIFETFVKNLDQHLD